MNIITESNDNQNTDERPEPFATILDLLADYTEGEILQGLSDNAEFDAEDEENCKSCRLHAARLHLELDQLLDRMAHFEEAINPEEAGETHKDEEAPPTLGVWSGEKLSE